MNKKKYTVTVLFRDGSKQEFQSDSVATLQLNEPVQMLNIDKAAGKRAVLSEVRSFDTVENA
jgi:hypothetical protein